MNFPQDLKYTKEHEWTRTEGTQVTIGITEFAVEQLGDITIVGFDVKPGDMIEHGKVFGTIESVKTVSDLYAPVSGKVVKINGDLDAKPELVNEDSYGAAWLIVIEADGAAGELMDPEAYAKHVAAS